MQPDTRIPRPATSFLEEDSNGWLVTFSDLVLQLFAFVMVAAVLGPGSIHGARLRAPRVAHVRAAAAEISEPDALSLARFDDLPPPTATAAAAACLRRQAHGPNVARFLVESDGPGDTIGAIADASNGSRRRS